MFSGRGFAFRRKQQIERQYRKLLKKRKVPSQQDDQFTDTYPEHLKHLYLAEEEMLKKRRRAPDAAVLSEEKLNEAEECGQYFSISGLARHLHGSCWIRLFLSFLHWRRKWEFFATYLRKKVKELISQKGSSTHFSDKHYCKEAEKRKQQREEAQRLYKQKKMEAYKIFSKKTKKGQPNLNLQMEFLLQKIQQNT
uniref:Thyroid transcription factor 1-associated protein 26 n=1 Tax=Columba livia TaxID=8932 RepID=R7VY11_COLLI